MSWMIIETKNHRLVRMLFLLNVECGENSAVVIGRGERFIGAPKDRPSHGLAFTRGSPMIARAAAACNVG
ncbi:MAG: hypothetical protein AUH72_20510 [Acidobacteria bacterium 13_1_40CM_4_65_8]|nr:MAG: hypothetical protein AUH72_20510 [Acidobacteria bacterium 13_1_40CM_4_65_8]